MHYAKNKMELVPAHVYLITSGIPMKVVDLNVSLIQIVHQTWHVLGINVKILVQALVVKMLIVMLYLTCHYVLVYMDLPVIHFDTVAFYTYNVRSLLLLCFFLF